MKFLIKYATRGRPVLFEKSIENINSTISKKANYQIIVTADNNDFTMSCFNDMKFKNTIIIFGDSKNKIEAINANMNICNDWDVLINFSDDMKFVVNEWDKIMKNDFNNSFNNLDFFAHYNDGYVGKKLPTMSIMGKQYYERDNYIYHPSYKSESCDAEAMYVAMMRGCHKYFDKILFKHEHPCNTSNSKNDKTYSVNGNYAIADHNNYFERMKHNFYVKQPKFPLPINPNDYR